MNRFAGILAIVVSATLLSEGGEDANKVALTTPKAVYLSYSNAVSRRDWKAAEGCLASETREKLKDAIADRTFFDQYVCGGFKSKTLGYIPVCPLTEQGTVELDAFDRGPNIPGPGPRRFSATVASGGGAAPWMATCHFVKEKDGWKLTADGVPIDFGSWYKYAIPERARGLARELEGKPVEQTAPRGAERCRSAGIDEAVLCVRFSDPRYGLH